MSQEALQLSFFPEPDEVTGQDDFHLSDEDLLSYDHCLIMFSGGKDSISCVLDLLERGVPREKIELWHHCIDGKNNEFSLMDWPVTEDYCRKFAEALGIPIYFSWKDGAFKGEMLRDNEPTKGTYIETPDGTIFTGGNSTKLNTRLKFPQVSGDLRVRYCSSYLKIDVGSKAITHQSRFNNRRSLIVSGERALESSMRAKYLAFEPDRTDARNSKSLKRHVDRYRPVHKWTTEEVWTIIERWKIRPHPAYELGWGRLSCLNCIFGSKNQWCSVRKINPLRFKAIADYEKQFGVTIHRKYSVVEQADMGEPYPSIRDDLVALAMGETYTESIIVDIWTLPAGAYGESNGPI